MPLSRTKKRIQTVGDTDSAGEDGGGNDDEDEGDRSASTDTTNSTRPPGRVNFAALLTKFVIT
jgi:hypothetical protein